MPDKFRFAFAGLFLTSYVFATLFTYGLLIALQKGANAVWEGLVIGLFCCIFCCFCDQWPVLMSSRVPKFCHFARTQNCLFAQFRFRIFCTICRREIPFSNRLFFSSFFLYLFSAFFNSCFSLSSSHCLCCSF